MHAQGGCAQTSVLATGALAPSPALMKSATSNGASPATRPAPRAATSRAVRIRLHFARDTASRPCQHGAPSEVVRGEIT